MTNIRSIYDTKCQRFVLIRNSEVKILPDDVLDLATFPDKFLLDDEPEGFDVAKIELSRDVWHGFNYEYTLDSLMFSCDYGKAYLETIFFEDGTDADVKFVYGYGTLEELNVLYVGKLDFNNYGLENAEYVKANLRKDDFGNILQSAFDIPQEVLPDRDILLYSKVIPKKVEYSINPLENQPQSTRRSSDFGEFDGGFSRNSGDGYLFLNETKEGNSDLEIFPQYPFQLDNAFPPTESAGLKFLFRAKEEGLYKIKFRHELEVRASYTNNGDWDETLIKNVIKQNYFITESDGETQVGAVTSIEPTVLSVVDNGNPLAVILIRFDATVEVQMSFDRCFYYYILFDSDAMPALPSPPQLGLRIFNVFSLPFEGDRTTPQIEIVGETTANLSKSKVIRPYDALNNIFKQGAEIDSYDIVKSDFFDDGCGTKLNLTNGFNIRGVNDRPLIDSPKKLFEKFGNLFCLGWGIEYDGITNNEVVRIEPAEYFYQDTLLLRLSDISDYELNVDPQAYYNEIESGFTRYSQQRETEKGNTLDDVHTKHIYQTPIKTNKSKLAITTDLILSGYELEFLRRKQFDNDGRNENASFREDDEVFGVQILSDTLFEGIYREFEDIIQGANNRVVLSGTEFYFYIGQEVTVNTDGQGAKTNTIQSITYGEATPVGFPDPIPATEITFTNNYDPFINIPSNRTIEILLVNESYIVPESNQPFESVSNIVSPQTGYNLRYTPKRILLNWAKLYNGGFRTKGEGELISFKKGDGNVDFTHRFRSTEACLLGDVNRVTLKEGESISLLGTFNRDYLFLPYKVTFRCALDFEELNYIRRAMRGVSADSNNYGYLEYVSPNGATEQIYITKITFDPTELEAEIEGWLRDIGEFIVVDDNLIIDELDQPIIDEINNPISYE